MTTPNSLSTRLPYAIAIFLSAFLLFQVQPLIGRYIMPWFGTTPGVWLACLVFFQLMLLAGYGYAHLIASFLSTPNQVRVHVGLLVVTLLALPIIPSPEWKTTGSFDPALRIILLLGATVGLPYLLLSSTAPLLQKWFSTTGGETSKTSTYRLYAISNAGSLLALLTYPLFFERFFKLQTQTLTWSAGFLAFVVLVVFVARSYTKAAVVAANPDSKSPAEPPTKQERRSAKAAKAGDVSQAPVALRRILLWFALSATGSLMLLATTNRLSQDVPATPFLFVLPLAVYLTTFIIAFDNPRWYSRPVFCVVLVIGMVAACTESYQNIHLELNHRIIIYAAALFATCICCHGELARLKPDPRHLTLYFLILALGGACGGVMVALVAPVVFNGFWEYEIGLVASFGLVMFLNVRDLPRRSRLVKSNRHRKKAAKRKKGQSSPGAGVAPHFARLMAGVAALAFAALIGVLGYHFKTRGNGVIAQDRSFYGVVRVVETDKEQERAHRYKLYHGEIIHGMQLRHPGLRQRKIAYYGDESGVGLAIHQHPRRFLPGYDFRIGVVGLGAGSIAAFANEQRRAGGRDDLVHFYEIDPMVVRFAENYFTFLEDARDRGAEIEISIGDARIVMERQFEAGRAAQFDVLAIDAFSGDSIPIHLLTEECFEIFMRHLRPDGVLAFHVSSRYLDLLPVVKALAEQNRQQVHFIQHEADTRGGASSRWVLVTNNGLFSNREIVRATQTPVDRARSVLWTDDFSSLFDVVR